MTFREWFAQPDTRALADECAHRESSVQDLALAAWNAARLDLLESLEADGMLLATK